jgi:hypothetical protein
VGLDLLRSTEVNVPMASHHAVTDRTVASKALAGFELRIVDENDREVAVGEVGVRGPRGGHAGLRGEAQANLKGG